MAEAVRAVAQGTADDDQRRRAVAMDDARTHEERRAIWMGYAPGSGPGQPPHRAVA